MYITLTRSSDMLGNQLSMMSSFTLLLDIRSLYFIGYVSTKNLQI